MEAVFYFHHKEISLDTPGHMDIFFHAIQAFTRLDGIIQCIWQDNADINVPQTAGIWQKEGAVRIYPHASGYPQPVSHQNIHYRIIGAAGKWHFFRHIFHIAFRFPRFPALQKIFHHCDVISDVMPEWLYFIATGFRLFHMPVQGMFFLFQQWIFGAEAEILLQFLIREQDTKQA